jgi:hypothetical protein
MCFHPVGLPVRASILTNPARTVQPPLQSQGFLGFCSGGAGPEIVDLGSLPGQLGPGGACESDLGKQVRDANQESKLGEQLHLS